MVRPNERLQSGQLKGSGLEHLHHLVTQVVDDLDRDAIRLRLGERARLQSLLVDAWRLERDYFYDPGLHGVDWKAMRTKYAPLAARVTDRSELNDVIAQMVGELSALHIFVRGGDNRAGMDTIAPASLGAVLDEDAARGGWRITHMYRSDPDIPDELGPLAKPDVALSEGDVIVVPISMGREADLRLFVEKKRQELLTSGALIKNGAFLEFTQDVPFSSPSGAASVVRGGSSNGLRIGAHQTARLWGRSKGRVKGL